MKTILLSIQFQYIGQIKQGKKQYEFRRRYPLKERAFAFIYVPRPVKAITMWAIFGKPIYGTIEELLRLRNPINGQERTAFLNYLKGIEKGYAIPILKHGEINPIITVGEMKQYKVPVPQHIVYLDKYKGFLDIALKRTDFKAWNVLSIDQ